MFLIQTRSIVGVTVAVSCDRYGRRVKRSMATSVIAATPPVSVTVPAGRSSEETACHHRIVWSSPAVSESRLMATQGEGIADSVTAACFHPASRNRSGDNGAAAIAG